MKQAANFKAYSQYYDAFYQDKNYGEEAACVADLIHKLHPTAKTILELGCGTGNHARFLSQLGFRTTGLEKSEEMVTLAKEKNISGFEPIVADIRRFQLPQKFDVAISLFHVISYLNLNRDLVSCFQCVNAHLKEEGLFVFDAWYSPAIYHQRPEKRVRQLSSGDLEMTRQAEPVSHINQNVVDVGYQILIRDTTTNHTEIIQEQHSMRHFSVPEIELLAEFTGFTLVGVQELLSGNEPGIDSWGICFVLKKNRDLYTR
jgi:predicted TPR repeat methyltransferase